VRPEPAARQNKMLRGKLVPGDGRAHKEGGTPAEYGAALEYAIAKGWLWKHESGTYVKFTQAGAELFA
jgi:hypothetical protein